MAEIKSFLDPNADKEIRKYIASLQKIAGNYKVIAEGSLKIQEANNKEIKNETELIKKQQQLEVLAQKKIKTTKDEISLKEKQAKTAEKQKKAIEAENSAYQKLANAYKISATRAKDLAAKYGVNSREARKASKEALNYKNQLDKINAGVGNYTGKVGGYFQAIGKSMIAAGVAMISFRAAFNIIKSSIKTMASFEEAMSKVKAVAKALPADFKKLQANAKELGASTSKTAMEVAGLQLEFAKLGFTTPEILAATEATISLSIAAGADLAESAVVAASTVRGFGLTARETQRVVDVMALSFSSSALDIEKFKTGMGVVAPVAKSFGKDIEFTTAQMSVLADAGVDASTAGTSLRNIFLTLSKNGLTWEQGLEKINKASNKNVAALDLFGKRGATAALILADNVEKATELEKAYDNANGAAEEMARIMGDNLIGDTKKLSSAWEGFILGMNKGSGTITRVLRNAVQRVTELVQWLTKLNLTQAEQQDILNNKDIEDYYNNIYNKVETAVKAVKTLEEAEKQRAEMYKEELDKLIILSEKYHKLEEETAGDDIERSEEYKNAAIIYDGIIEKLKTVMPIITTTNETFEELSENFGKITADFITKLRSMKIPRANIVDEWIIRENEKKEIATKLAKDAQYFADHLFPNNFSTSERPQQLTLEVKKITEELLKEIGITIDDSPVTFWDKFLALDPEELNKVVKQVTDAFSQLNDSLFELGTAQRERETANIESEYAKRIEAAQANGENTTELERELAVKRAMLDREQTKAEKRNAIFKAFINLAEGITAALINPVTAPFVIPFISTIAGIQIAAITARPLPELPAFEKGTDNAPAGNIIFGEKGREIVVPKNGKAFIANEPTLASGLQGAKIFSNRETEIILRKQNNNKDIVNKLDRVIESIENNAAIVKIDKKLSNNINISHFNKKYGWN